MEEKHPYSKSHGDGFPRHYCNICGLHKDHPIHELERTAGELAVSTHTGPGGS